MVLTRAGDSALGIIKKKQRLPAKRSKREVEVRAEADFNGERTLLNAELNRPNTVSPHSGSWKMELKAGDSILLAKLSKFVRFQHWSTRKGCTWMVKILGKMLPIMREKWLIINKLIKNYIFSRGYSHNDYLARHDDLQLFQS